MGILRKFYLAKANQAMLSLDTATELVSTSLTNLIVEWYDPKVFNLEVMEQWL
jgi:hypothetical protein